MLLGKNSGNNNNNNTSNHSTTKQSTREIAKSAKHRYAAYIANRQVNATACSIAFCVARPAQAKFACVNVAAK